jgi:carboxyl-terminal processing protease
VGLEGDDLGLKAEQVGGGYGLAITGLDDGRVIAHIVLTDGPAAKAGLEIGAEILEWNGQPIEPALSQVKILWSEQPGPPATNENLRLEQYRFRVRSPVGAEATIVFQNPDSASPVTVTLTAVDDNMETLKRTDLRNHDLSTEVQFQILPSGYGYIRFTVLYPVKLLLDLTDPERSRELTEEEILNQIFQVFYEPFKQAIHQFLDRQVPGVIVDLRGNGGGGDLVAAVLSSFFYTEEDHYQYATYYDPDSGEFEITQTTLISNFLEPQEPAYTGPVVALVNRATQSAAEGIPMAIQRLPQGHVIGFNGTSGSFAIGLAHVKMPGDYYFEYSPGRSLDVNKVIQLDSRDGEGGVVPDIRVPRTEATMIAFGEGQDVELEFAIQTLDRLASEVAFSHVLDLNHDGIVDLLDLVLISKEFGKKIANLDADINQDGVIDISDLVLLGKHFGEKIQN